MKYSMLFTQLLFLMLLSYDATPEEEDITIFKNHRKNYYKYEHICVFMCKCTNLPKLHSYLHSQLHTWLKLALAM